MAGAVSIQENDYYNLNKGGNTAVKATLEVPAGAARTITKGTFVTQKTGDGTKYVLHTEQLTTPIDGYLNNDLAVAEDVGATDHSIYRTYKGMCDVKILEEVNAITITDIPAGTAESYLTQLENKGFQPIDPLRL